jgi:hypothetical protein
MLFLPFGGDLTRISSHLNFIYFYIIMNIQGIARIIITIIIIIANDGFGYSLKAK